MSRGVDLSRVPESLRRLSVKPGDPRFSAVASTYMRGGSPGLVLQPQTVPQVADAIAFAREHRHLPLGVRSAGHGIRGRSTNDGGLVIDVGHFNRIEVLDRERRLIRIGPGATWKQVAHAIAPYGWAIGSGDYGGVGVGGLTLAGGIGLLGRQFGLTLDHLRAVELVLADGSPVRASADENPDLFWAMRGAGAAFGVTTALEFEVDEVGDVAFAQLVVAGSDMADLLFRFGELAQNAPRDTTMFAAAGPPRGGYAVLQMYGMVASGDHDTIVERLTPFAQLGPLADQRVVAAPYADIMASAQDRGPDGHRGRGEPAGRSGLLPSMTREFAQDAADMLASGKVYFFQMRTMGGAVADVPDHATAFSGRNASFAVNALGLSEGSIDAAWAPLTRYFEHLYLSFDTDRRPERALEAFGEPTLSRLLDLKQRFDPTNLFRDNLTLVTDEQAVDVAGAAGALPGEDESASESTTTSGDARFYDTSNAIPDTRPKEAAMTRYGHDPFFGTFVTPSAADPAKVVDLAVLADREGLDLVTFQDHPYQPSFLDTWTLMSYAAARTERITLSGNVLNLPLRPPAVLARAAASLDLLSGGRFELGIGAGGFWDAMVGMGSRRLTAGQSVKALREGIEIIRDLWDTEARGGVRYDGEFYTISGAKRGPAPAHDIGMWIGAYGPKMLALTGSHGDGWLPSLAYLKKGPEQLREMNEMIDAGAEKAGRRPEAVRRLLNIHGRFSPQSRGLLDGPAEQWAEELTWLAQEFGISGFILATDDETTTRIFANEVAPATRNMLGA